MSADWFMPRIIMVAPTTSAQVANEPATTFGKCLPDTDDPESAHRQKTQQHVHLNQVWSAVGPDQEAQDQRQQSRKAQDNGCDTDDHNGEIFDSNLLSKSRIIFLLCCR